MPNMLSMAFILEILLVVVFLNNFKQGVCAQDTGNCGLGPGYCLISNIDTVPCTFPPKSTTPRPGINEYGKYETRYITGATGCPECRILRRNHKIRRIFTVGSANKMMLLYSPRYRRRYDSNLYVEYNINCGPGRLAYFQLTDMNLEPANCWDPNTRRQRCVDYVHVDSGQFGSQQVCGRSKLKPFSGRSSLRVIFRSNHHHGYPGFAASVICYEATLPQCSRQKRDLSIDMERSLGRYVTPQLSFARELEDYNELAPLSETNQRLSAPAFAFRDQDIRHALVDQNSCNPVLRAAARSIIEETNKTKDGRSRLAHIRFTPTPKENILIPPFEAQVPSTSLSAESSSLSASAD